MLKLKISFLFIFTIGMAADCAAQDSTFRAKHRAIFFPYPMYKEKWRSALGFSLLTTPEDITEEVRIRIPCGDFTVLRRISDHFTADGKIAFQFLQNHLSAGVQYVQPLSKRFYLSAGNDAGFWFGLLKLSSFNSKASGWLTYPHASFGWMTRKDLLITVKAQLAFNLYYQASNGENHYSSDKRYYNGEMFTIALEQPFYQRKHLALALSAINNYFYWQTWSLFYKTNRKVFYPQITVAFIL